MSRRTHAGALVTLLVVALAVVAATGCGGDGDVDGNEQGGSAALDGSDWRLLDWSADEAIPADLDITLVFDASLVAGSSGVNQFSGSYSTGADGAFALSNVNSTQIGAPQEVMDFEAAYMGLLIAADTYRREDDGLTLSGAEGSLVFEPLVLE